MRPPNYYTDLYRRMEIAPGWIGRIAGAHRIICSGFSHYMDVQIATGIPWKVVGVIHMMESGCDWKAGLHNGQRWDRKTTLVPAGVGPFASWQDAAIDALRKRGAPRSTEEIGAFFERYNGMGYERRGKNSPYLWSGSTAGIGTGKYEADGKYNPYAVSRQVGAMVLLRALGWPV